MNTIYSSISRGLTFSGPPCIITKQWRSGHGFRVNQRQLKINS